MSSRFRASARVLLAVCVLLALGTVAPAAIWVAAAPAPAPAAGPASFTVNSINDNIADFTGDPNFTICRTNVANTTCTLRAAIMNANRHAGGAIIHLPANLPYTLIRPPALPRSDADGGLEISNTLTLIGAGAAGTIVDGGALDSVFFIFPGTTVTMTGLTIRNGLAAGLNSGGGIDNAGQLNLANSVLRDNSAGFGGGLVNGKQGTATLTNDTFTRNRATNLGGGIINNGSLALNASTVDHNTANSGGGIYNELLGSLTLFDSTLSNNSARVEGGGLVNDHDTRLFHTTVAGNLAQNPSLGDHGGGLLNTTLIQSVQIWNSLLVDNFSLNDPSDCAGTGLESQGYNYINFNGQCPITGTTTGNLIVIQNPLEGELADNGGPTLTRALSPGSIVADQIPPALCQDPFGTAPVPDQRGVLRPVGPQCDMGAFEGQPATPIYDHNLLRNGDGEASAGSTNDAVVGVPNWLLLAPFKLTVANYNPAAGFPSVVTQTVPANHGDNLFAGGYTTSSAAFQIVDFEASGINTAVDAGAVRYLLTADLGGFGTQNDFAAVTLQFVNHIGAAVGAPIVMNGPNAAGRSNQTSLLPFSAVGVVPPLARGCDVRLTLTRTSGPGTYNDGYADNLSFMLLPPPLFLPLLMR